MKISVKYYPEVKRNPTGSLSKAEFPLVMSCCYQGLRMKMHLGIKLHLHHWDSSLHRFSHSFPDARSLNAFLDKTNEIVQKVLIAFQERSEIPGPEILRKEVRKLLPSYSRSFFDLYLEFMEVNHSRWTNNTYMKVRTLYSILREYNRVTGEKLCIHSFSIHDFRQIESYFVDSRNFALKTTYTYLTMLKWFLHWASSRTYYYNPALVLMKPLKDIREAKPGEIHYLNRDELFGLLTYVGLSRKEERIRDIFCFICFTGITYSGLKSIRKEDVTGSFIKNPGSGEAGLLPLNKYALEILKKYSNVYYRDDKLFQTFSELTVNLYLKKIAFRVGFKRLVYFTETKTRKEIFAPLHSLMTIGMARHTFIMNALGLGVSEESLARMAGGKSTLILKRYKKQLEAKDVEEMKKFNSI